jgi:hypothetical protein
MLVNRDTLSDFFRKHKKAQLREQIFSASIKKPRKRGTMARKEGRNR